MTGAVDLSIEMTKSEDGKTATVRCRKQKDAEEFHPFIVRAEPTGPSLTLSYDSDAQPEAEAKRDRTAEEWVPVLRHLPADEAKALKVGQIIDLTGIPDATVRDRLSGAFRHGVVEKVGERPARYFLTPKGVELLKSKTGKPESLSDKDLTPEQQKRGK